MHCVKNDTIGYSELTIIDVGSNRETSVIYEVVQYHWNRIIQFHMINHFIYL